MKSLTSHLNLNGISLLLVFIVSFNYSFGAKKYAAPAGTSTNSGITESSPWSLSYAFSENSNLSPGDSLILLSGEYGGNFILNKSGTAQRPIYILAKEEGNVIIDTGKNRTTGTGIIINGSNVWLVNIHVTSSSIIKREDLGEVVPYESGISVFGSNVKLINCWIYDIPGGGLELWRPAFNLEVYGCIIFNNGSQSPVRGTGHGMYVQHDEPDFPKIIRNNFVFNNASQGINIYTTNPPNGAVIVLENTAFNTGSIANFNSSLFRAPHNLNVGSENSVTFSIRSRSNMFYSDLQNGRLSNDNVNNVSLGNSFKPNSDFQFSENFIFGGFYQVQIQPLEKFDFTKNRFYNLHGRFFQFMSVPDVLPSTVWDNNFYYQASNDPLGFTGLNFTDWKASSGFDNSSIFSFTLPQQPEVFLRSNLYDRSKFYLTILNLSESPSVLVDFSSSNIPLGTAYEIIDVQNPFDENAKISKIFDGNPIEFKMDNKIALAPKGNMPHSPTHTGERLGTFVIKFRLSASSPVSKDSVTLEIDEQGLGLVQKESLFSSLGNYSIGDFSYSKLEFSCSDLGNVDLVIKLNPNLGTWSDTVRVHVVDRIPPYAEIADAVLAFDPSIGRMEVNISDFSIRDISDNCSSNMTLEFDRELVFTCEDFTEPNSSGIYKFPIKVTVKDQSGNSFVKTTSVIVQNFIETKKVTVTSQGPLGAQNSKLILGDELKYEVISWHKNGELIPNQIEKELLVNSSGSYYAMLLLENGCTVQSQLIEFQQESYGINEVINLSLIESGQSQINLSSVFKDGLPVNSGIQLSQSTFNCLDIGENWVKVFWTVNPRQEDLSGSYKVEYWLKVNVEDKISPSAIIIDRTFDFDLAKGELVLNPRDFVQGEIIDNCLGDDVTIKLSQEIITCRDIDSERVSYYLDLEVTISDKSGNTSVYPTFVLLNIKESTKVSLSANGPLLNGGTTELRLGEELDFQVLEWRKDLMVIEGAKSKSILISEPGRYVANLLLENGCLVGSEVLLVEQSEFPFFPLKTQFTITIPASGKATIQPQDLFSSWPPADPNLDIKLSQSEFTCSDLGEKQVVVTIKNQSGQTWEEKTLVKIQDNTAPLLTPKNLEVNYDITQGSISLKPEDFLTAVSDNCSVKELTISKTSISCEDLGKEFSITIRAVDASGNVSEATSKLTVNRVENQKVTISGTDQLCQGQKGILTLTSSQAFEVVRWRRNGVEVSGQTGKTLEVSEPGKYHAVIRYPGACLSETVEFEVKVNPLPSGQIEVDGNILRAPAGDFTYQWFRNGEKINGATNRVLTVDLMGEYAVEMTSQAGCTSKLAPVTLTISGLGSSWVKKPIELKIFPNPASSKVYIELPGDADIDVSAIQIYNMEGKKVSELVSKVKVSERQAELSISSLASGAYLVWIIGDSQNSYLGKFVIVK